MEGDKLITISEPLTARPKKYSTGSKGLTIDGQRCQFSGNAVIIGSKNKK
jgi:hypothetical protein